MLKDKWQPEEKKNFQPDAPSKLKYFFFQKSLQNDILKNRKQLTWTTTSQKENKTDDSAWGVLFGWWNVLQLICGDDCTTW